MQTLTLKLTLLFFVTYTLTFSQNQFEDIGNVAEDLVFLSGQFITPAAEAAVYQSSGGWYTSAKKKELWEAEFSIQGNMLLIPGKANRFLVDESNLKNLRVKGDATTAFLPTAFGNDEFVVMEGNIGDETFEFDSPEGFNESSIMHAQLQAAVGLWKGTTITGRYSPEIKINDTEYQLYGFGIQHNISQWIRDLEESDYDVSFLATYGNFNVGDEFNEVSLALGTTINSVLVDGETLSFNMIASRTFGSFDVSGALGLTSSNFEYSLGGQGDLILEILNEALKDLNGNQMAFKTDINVNYNFKDFSVNSMLTFCYGCKF